MNPDKIVLKLATEISNVLLSLEMGEKPVEEVELPFCTRNGTAQASKVMQLAEGTGKGCFATLVRAGNNDDSLSLLELKAIADRSYIFADKYSSQGQIEALVIIHLFRYVADEWIAETQSHFLEDGYIIQPGDIELDLPVERDDRCIGKIFVNRTTAVRLITE